MKHKKLYLTISIVSFSAALAAAIVIGVLLFSYRQADAHYDRLAKTVRTAVPAQQAAPPESADHDPPPQAVTEPQVMVDIPINFDYLRDAGPDIIGWIVVDGTLIDYPIVYDTTFNFYYLSHNYEGTSTGYGSIFVLGENAGDFSDFNTVVYGHNMLDGRMFAQLHRFRDRNFFDSHGQIVIYTPDRQLTYRVFAAYRRDNLDIVANHDFSTDELKEQYISSIYAQTDLAQFRREYPVSASDRILTLSTCIGNPAYRFVVQGVLVSEEPGRFVGVPAEDGGTEQG